MLLHGQVAFACVALLASWSVTVHCQSFSELSQARRYLGSKSVELGESPEAARRLPELKGGYLYPVLAWGPNNQVAGLKEALVLGRLLRRTVIVHDILNHYDEAKKSGKAVAGGSASGPKSMDFDLVFDLDHLCLHQSVVTLAERRQGGWDLHLDAVAHFGDMFLGQIKNARALGVSDEGSPYLDFEEFKCVESQIEKMIEDLKPYKHVAFIVYENIVRDAGHGVKLRVTGELCHDEYLRVSAQLTKSPRLVGMATRFREQRLGGGDRPYVAVHLRPYPDKCLWHWKQDRFETKRAAGACKNANLYNVFVQQTADAMRKNDVKVLFVMSYPELRPVISQMYGKVGIKPVYYNEEDLEDAVGYRSISLLGMVEEEIAYEADVFIGTSYSSMTGIIMQERYARGKPMTSTLLFTKTSSG
ncbi:hypothetical protein HYH03_004371 [Edaphochlamys debaryana]|uniref:O-fucosyltransferase family protein n=1 Tax=Edaphochlamys debaryana TaxID=47281 RepID=A0A835YB79_9CHLO|nr:hypothetical protein HYH03_004371 [Edaphochlamys debaryana]|eukprot:KAG2497631.1 hypothetical protein HYH03_004371 [Edaphochlamys debaryana]